jgi:GNAT superfamily N-acetyltransferase
VMCGSRPGSNGESAGVVALAPGDAPDMLNLNKLFVEPCHIRSGVGRALLAHAVAEGPQRALEDWRTGLSAPPAFRYPRRHQLIRNEDHASVDIFERWNLSLGI